MGKKFEGKMYLGKNFAKGQSETLRKTTLLKIISKLAKQVTPVIKTIYIFNDFLLHQNMNANINDIFHFIF